MRPIVMPPNRLDHLYLGGSRIIGRRGLPATSERSPEGWLATVTRSSSSMPDSACRSASLPIERSPGATSTVATARRSPGTSSRPIRGTASWTRPDSRTLQAVLPAGADPFLRVHVARPVNAVEVGPGFCAAIALDGGGDLDTDDDLVSVSRGDVLAVPLAGPWQVPAGVTAIVCRPGTDGPGQAV